MGGLTGGKGGGGSIDTSGLEKATNRSIDLQEEIYGQTREDVQPWYQMGVGSVNRLSDLLGIGGGSVMNRDQLYSELLPQYTTAQTSTSGQDGLFVTPDGNVVTVDGAMSDMSLGRASLLSKAISGTSGQDPVELLQDYGYSPYATTSTQDIVDYDALNAAVDERLSDQQVPDDYGSLLERFDLTKFEEDPGAEYRRQESQKALERSMAAQGVTLGGGGYGEINPQVARALEEQSQGIAAQEYGNAYNRYVQDQLNTYNMLMGTAGMGQGSTGILATGGQNYATNVGNLTTGLAGAQLNAQMAEAAQPSMFSSLLGAGTQLGSAAIYASDIRLKENIKLKGIENGHNVYEFSYIDDDKKYIGVMAHEVKKIKPSAVTVIDGFMAVDYDKIGVEMREA